MGGGREGKERRNEGMERLNLRTRDRKRMGIEGLQILGECIFIEERERKRGER